MALVWFVGRCLGDQRYHHLDGRIRPTQEPSSALESLLLKGQGAKATRHDHVQVLFGKLSRFSESQKTVVLGPAFV